MPQRNPSLMQRFRLAGANEQVGAGMEAFEAAGRNGAECLACRFIRPDANGSNAW